MQKNYIGIDIGGTFVKGGVLTENGTLSAFDSIPTHPQTLASDVADFCIRLQRSANVQASAVGIGIPGMIDSDRGTVVFAGNLGYRNYPIAEKVSALLGLPVFITNDANAAALGESRYGAGKDYSDSILVTLGTGVGGGIILGGKLFAGRHAQGAEIGHTVIRMGGEQCTCGRRGCFEAYASATALIRDTRRVGAETPDSLLHKLAPESIDGKTAFDLAERDAAAQRVVENYVENLACGLANLANIFRPDVILLGGGVANQGESLLQPLQRIFDRELFGRGLGSPVPILAASLGNRAGTLGAAAYALDCSQA